MAKGLLEEYEWYKFKIHNEIDYPGEGQKYVLIDRNGYKHLLSKDYYEHYSFQVGQDILCRIDKINCSGNIFLEPEHPFYKEGNSYLFDIVEQKTIVNSLSTEEKVWVVADIFGNKMNLPYTEVGVINNKIECIVENIKKGRLLLITKGERRAIAGIKEGDSFYASINKVITSAEQDEYYVLIDENGNEFLLGKKYYANYNYSVGDKIKCSVVKIRSQWDYVLEPEHPYYIIGHTYFFKIYRKEIDVNYQMKNVYFLISNDIYNLECRAEVDKETYDIVQVGDTVECVVERIKKSKLLLKLK